MGIEGITLGTPAATRIDAVVSNRTGGRGRRIRAVVAGLVVALLATAAPAQASDTIEPRARTTYELAVEAELVRLHNAARAEPSLFGFGALDAAPPMSAWTDIRKVTRSWSQTLAESSPCENGATLCHNVAPNSAVPFWDEYECWARAAENVVSTTRFDRATLRETPAEMAEGLMTAWMNSDGHRDNIMDADFDEFAVGVQVESFVDPTYGSSWRIYGTTNFRARRAGCDVNGSRYGGPATAPAGGDDGGTSGTRTGTEPAPRPESATDGRRTVTRVSGPDRYATAIELARAWDRAPVAVIASGANYPDALAAAPVAGVHDAPVLLTPPAQLDPRVGETLARLGTSTVFLMGGTAALSDQVRADLEAAGIAVRRIAGQSRWETAALAAREVAARTDVDEVLLVEGANVDPSRGWPDALSAAAYAARRGTPVLLTDSSSLPAETAEELTRLGPDRVIAVGGTVAVSEAVHARAAHAAGAVGVRYAGESRYHTSATVDRFAVDAPVDADVVYVSTGRNWADALAAGPAAAHRNGTMLLIDGQVLAGAQATLAYLDERYPTHDIAIAGGAAAVGTSIADALER